MSDQNKAGSNITLGEVNELPVHIFQSHGPRAEQQDNMALFALDNALDEDTLRALFQQMSNATNDFGYGMGGACVNLVMVADGKIMAANLGDSLSTLFTRLAKGDELLAQKLSTIHSPHNADEAKRLAPLIDPFNLHIENGRVVKVDGDRSTSLAMSRALGNKEFAPMVTQNPNIHHFELDVSAYDYAQIALYTDGVPNTHKYLNCELDYDADYLATILNSAMNGSKNLYTPAAYNLAELSIDGGLLDNATAMSLDLKRLPTDQPVLIAVLDGHGPKGREITEAAIEALHQSPLLT